MSRRYARLQSLPQEEVDVLNSLTGPTLHKRASALYLSGWTLASIGNALTPPRTRSTIKSWVDRYPSPDVDVPTPTPIPTPTYRTHPEGYQRLTPKSPGVPDYIGRRLQEIAPKARLYRHRMPSGHPYALANEEMNELVLALRAHNVSIADIARAANVTHRAIARRIQALAYKAHADRVD